MHLASGSECPTLVGLCFTSMGEVKRASKEYSKNPGNVRAKQVLESYRLYRLSCIRTSLFLLWKAGLPKRALISGRLKRLPSVLKKMRRDPDFTSSLNNMNDVIGFRVVCESLQEAIDLGERIKDRIPAETRNYVIEKHKMETGYRAIHGIVRFGQPLGNDYCTARFEIQVRTWYQHQWACLSESFGEQAKAGFRNNARTERDGLKTYLNECSQKIASWEDLHHADKQVELPSVSNSYSLAIAWIKDPEQYRLPADTRLVGLDVIRPRLKPQGDYDIRYCDTDVDKAVKHLRHLEGRRELQPLLLVGVTDAQHLKSVLLRTHPNFVDGIILDPQYWLPN